MKYFFSIHLRREQAVTIGLSFLLWALLLLGIYGLPGTATNGPHSPTAAQASPPETPQQFALLHDRACAHAGN